MVSQRWDGFRHGLWVLPWIVDFAMGHRISLWVLDFAVCGCGLNDIRGVG